MIHKNNIRELAKRIVFACGNHPPQKAIQDWLLTNSGFVMYERYEQVISFNDYTIILNLN